MTKWVFLNGCFMEEEKAVLHYRDLSFQRGYGIFDFFRLVGNEPLFLEDYLGRFYSSAIQMRLQIPYKEEELKRLLLILIQKNNWPNTGIRLSLTGGYSADGFNIGEPNLLISQHLFTSPTAAQRQNGLKLISYSYQRQLPEIKSIDYLMAIWLKPLQTEQGADDLLYHYNGVLSECPRSNIFLVMKDNSIVTPGKNVLKGMTRQKVIELARKYYTVEEREVFIDEIKEAKEAFITSTTKQILAVRQIDQVHFANQDVSTHLLKLFRQELTFE